MVLWLGLPAPGQAAEASDLTREVVGVTGSGDQMQLRLSQDGAIRNLKPGDLYREGWILTGLTASEATLARDGVSQKIGLNPAGTVRTSAAPDDPTKVVVVLSTEQIAKAYSAPYWNGQPRLGLTMEQTLRFEYYTAMLADVMVIGQPTPREKVLAAIGEAGMADRDQLAKLAFDANEAKQLAINASMGGPSSYYVAAGISQAEAMRAAGVNPSGSWMRGPIDSQGGYRVERATIGQYLAASRAATGP